VLGSTAAGSVLEIGDDVHRWSSVLWFLSGCNSLADDSLCSGSNGPDEAEQFTSNGRNDFPVVLASCAQFDQRIGAGHSILTVGNK
jgi:hypothetical protein